MENKSIFLRNILILFIAAAVFFFRGSVSLAQISAPAGPREAAMFAALDSREMAMASALREKEIAAALKEAATLPPDGVSQTEKSGPLSVIFSHARPYASLNTKYTDNLFGTQFSTKSEVVNTVDPGVRFVFSGRKEGESVFDKFNEIELVMGSRYVSFANRHSLDDYYPYAEFNAQIGRGSHRIKLNQSYSENYGLGSDLVLGDATINNSAKSSTEVGYEADYRKLGYGITYSNSNSYNEEDLKTNNSRGNDFTVTAFFKPSALPKTRIFLEYDYGWNEYPKSLSDSKNSIYRKYWIGARGKLSGKTTGLVKFGRQVTDMKSSTRDKKGTTVDINVDYDYSPLTTFRLTVNKGIVTSTLLSEGDAESTALSLNSRHLFARHRKFSFLLGLDYGNFKAGSGRKSKTFGGSSGLELKFNQWLISKLEYTYSKTDSETLNGSNRVNEVLLTTEAKF